LISIESLSYQYFLKLKNVVEKENELNVILISIEIFSEQRFLRGFKGKSLESRFK